MMKNGRTDHHPLSPHPSGFRKRKKSMMDNIVQLSCNRGIIPPSATFFSTLFLHSNPGSLSRKIPGLIPLNQATKRFRRLHMVSFLLFCVAILHN